MPDKPASPRIRGCRAIAAADKGTSLHDVPRMGSRLSLGDGVPPAPVRGLCAALLLHCLSDLGALRRGAVACPSFRSSGSFSDARHATGMTRVGGLLCSSACEMLSLRQFLRLRIVRLDDRQRVTRRLFQLLIPP
jgi:hypothetical protein